LSNVADRQTHTHSRQTALPGEVVGKYKKPVHRLRCHRNEYSTGYSSIQFCSLAAIWTCLNCWKDGTENA